MVIIEIVWGDYSFIKVEYPQNVIIDSLPENPNLINIQGNLNVFESGSRMRVMGVTIITPSLLGRHRHS